MRAIGGQRILNNDELTGIQLVNGPQQSLYSKSVLLSVILNELIGIYQ
jgi:hypothetical protein